MTPSVAVVVPAYRSADYLFEALASACGQTLPPAEIIVVDDGSPESLEPRLGPWLDRIVYVRQPNAGPAAARNRGVALTTADLIAFLDDDDLWEPGKLAAQVAFLESHPSCPLVCCDSWEFGQGFEPRRKSRGARVDLSLEGLLCANHVTTSTVVLRRSAFEDAGGFDEDPELIAVEDYDLWLRMAESGVLGWLAAPLARYRRRPASLSGPARFLAGVTRVLDKARQRQPGLQRRLFGERKAGLLRDLAWTLLEAGQVEQAFEPILEALALAPSHPFTWRLLARGLAARIPGFGPWVACRGRAVTRTAQT